MRSLILLLAAAPAMAGPARDADAWCDAHVTQRFRVVDREHWAPIGGDRVFTVEWRGHLDRDGRRDVILDEGDCGTQECMRAALVQCSDGSFADVFTGYAAALAVRPAPRGWAVLRIEHVGERDERGHRPADWSSLRFGREGYVE